MSNEFIEQLATVPFTTIVNRAQIADLSKDLKPRMGAERIITNDLYKIQNESGPNGEKVFGTNDERIRFIGDCSVDTGFGGSDIGPLISMTVDTSHVEVTFFGTGLNLLGGIWINTRGFDVSVDGGATSTINAEQTSAIIIDRRYSVNVPLEMASGLSLDWHTIKMSTVGSGSSFLYGFEILNESSQIYVPEGKFQYGGLEIDRAAGGYVDHDTGLTSVKGAHSIVQLKTDGSVSIKHTEVPDTTGSEILLNNEFVSDLTSWTDASTGGSSTAWDSGNGGRLEFTNSGSGGENAILTQDITTVIGQSYKLVGNIISGGTSSPNTIEFIIDGSNIVVQGDSQVTDTVSGLFVATATTTTVRVSTGSTLQAGTSYVGDVSVFVSESKFLSFTDHSNEEVVRKINFREFGASGTDDFSTLVGVTDDRAFTLSDGITTLVGDEVLIATINNIEGVKANNTSNSLTLTFIGTGLDIIGFDGEMTLYVDNVDQGTTTVVDSNYKNINICSNLSYGEHTIKLVRTTSSMLITDFIIYQPKKPTADIGHVEIADYNIMADYVFETTAGPLMVHQGGLRKFGGREATYIGSNWVYAIDPRNESFGHTIYTPTNGEYVEYTFIGSGVVLLVTCGTDRGNSLIEVDGSSDHSLLTTNFSSDVAGTGFVAATGVLDQLSSAGTSFSGTSVAITGLTHGKHTVRMTKQSGSFMGINGISVITPIHSYKSNDLVKQNELDVGSNGINLPIERTKNGSYAIGVDLSPATASTSRVLIPDMITTHVSKTGRIRADFTSSHYHGTLGASLSCHIYINGERLDGVESFEDADNAGVYGRSISLFWEGSVPIGSNTISALWVTDSGTGTMISNLRVLNVKDV